MNKLALAILVTSLLASANLFAATDSSVPPTRSNGSPVAPVAAQDPQKSQAIPQCKVQYKHKIPKLPSAND